MRMTKSLHSFLLLVWLLDKERNKNQDTWGTVLLLEDNHAIQLLLMNLESIVNVECLWDRKILKLSTAMTIKFYSWARKWIRRINLS